MGINEFISSIFTNWRKRKRDTEEVVGTKKQKVEDNYVLTPQTKDIHNNQNKRLYYHVGEELDATESRQVEYKEGGCLFKKEVLTQLVQKYASAFLNSEGGVLLAGVNDKGIVRGLNVSPKDWDTIVETVKMELDKFRPFVPSALYSCKTYPVLYGNSKKPFLSGNTDKLCVVEISFKKGIEGELYESGNHHVYLRRDGGVQGPLRPLDIKNFVISKYNAMLKDRKQVKEKEDEQKERMRKKNISYVTID